VWNHLLHLNVSKCALSACWRNYESSVLLLCCNRCDKSSFCTARFPVVLNSIGRTPSHGHSSLKMFFYRHPFSRQSRLPLAAFTDNGPFLLLRTFSTFSLTNAAALCNGNVLLSVRLFVCRLWNLLIRLLRGSTWQRVGAYRIDSNTRVLPKMSFFSFM